jgi:hypothetical protein
VLTKQVSAQLVGNGVDGDADVAGVDEVVTGDVSRGGRRAWPWMKSTLGVLWGRWKGRSSTKRRVGMMAHSLFPLAALILDLSGIGGATNIANMAYDHVLEVAKDKGSTQVKGIQLDIHVRDVPGR